MADQKRHLGDGVYVRFDGFNIHLAVNNHHNEVIIMEPSVIDAFQQFTRDIKEKS